MHSLGFQQVFAHYHGSFGEDYLKAIFLEQVLYIIVIGLVKYSILAFYWRLFGASIRIPCYILGAITTCWGIATVGRLISSKCCFADQGITRSWPPCFNVFQFRDFGITRYPRSASTVRVSLSAVWSPTSRRILRSFSSRFHTSGVYTEQPRRR